MRQTAIFAAFVAFTAIVGAQSAPHQSAGMPYDDELYRHLVYDGFDDPARVRQSWVLPYTNPWFYIRLGSATACDHAWRVTWREFHFWRAIVPVVAEQITGTPYTGQVHVGCDNRQPEHGWVIVRYVTPEEYEAETGRDWGGDKVWGHALIGATYGQVWLRYYGRPLRAPSSTIQALIMHEVGHVFGLFHTGRSNYSMRSTVPTGDTLSLFTGPEERAARAAYRAGRGSFYCGDPDRCRGIAPELLPPLDETNPPIAVN